MSFNSSAFAILTCLSMAAGGCTFTWGEGNFEDDGWSSRDDDGLVVGGGGSGATDGGDVGAGGDIGAGGDTGAGGDDGGSCMMEEQDPYGWEDCDDLPMSPSNMGGTCEDGSDAFAYAICLKAYDVFNPTDADYLRGCLADVPAASACDAEPVYACIDDLNASACQSDDVPELCQSWGDACGDGGDDFDVAMCSADLNVVNADAIDVLHACIADSAETSCQARYDVCIGELGAID
jgi:hypothetical protein